MLARYSGEIDARLNQVHNQRLAAADAGGAVGAYQARLAEAFDEATHDHQLVRAAAERARAQLHAVVTGRSAADDARAITAADLRAARHQLGDLRLNDLQGEEPKVTATQG